MLTVEDLRWAADEAEREAKELLNPPREYCAAPSRECAKRWQARAARFRAAAQTMEREGKRDGRDLTANDEHTASKS